MIRDFPDELTVTVITRMCSQFCLVKAVLNTFISTALNLAEASLLSRDRLKQIFSSLLLEYMFSGTHQYSY